MTTKTAESPGLARPTGIVMIVVGALGLILWLANKAFAHPPLPDVVMYANVSASALDIGLGIGVMMGRRAAWAFALAMAVVFLVVNLFALPGMVRAGWPVGGFSAVLCGLRVGWGVLLILARKEF
jgi:hypothetical protein